MSDYEYELDFEGEYKIDYEGEDEDELDVEGDFVPTDTDDFFKDETEYRPEIDAFDRINMLGTEPTERFYRQAEAIVLDLNEKVNPAPFSNRDIEKIKVTAVPQYEFKNATAYVLGYLGSSKKTGITKDSIDYVFKEILPKVQDTSVKRPDVVRYSKLWQSL